MTNLLEQRVKSYNFIKKLGEGSFATVYQSMDENNKNVVAIKAINTGQLNKSKKLRELVKT